MIDQQLPGACDAASQLFVSALSGRFLSPTKCLGFTLPYRKAQHMGITTSMESLAIRHQAGIVIEVA